MKLVVTVILIFVLADVLMIGYVLYRRFRKGLPEKVVQTIQAQWKEIINQGDHRHAIMDADKLLDYTLSQMGMKGSLGAKLKRAGHLFKSINAVWEAHKVRNNIAHQINYKVDTKLYKKTMLQFKLAFRDLRVF